MSEKAVSEIASKWVRRPGSKQFCIRNYKMPVLAFLG